MFGLGEDYFKRTNCSTFTVETHTTYIAEVLEGAEVRCTTQLMGFDDKRIHYFHRMYREADGALSATIEQMAVHVDLSVRRVRPMPDNIQDRLGAMLATHARIDWPDQAGRVMRLGGARRK
jgi:acyl-CoA thioester hydrolase